MNKTNSDIQMSRSVAVRLQKAKLSDGWGFRVDSVIVI